MSAIEAAANWILHSGIQNISADKKINGGFNCWFNLDKKNYPFTYSEITGYGITTLLYLYKRTKNKKFLDRAAIAAEWITTAAMESSGAVKTRYYYDKTDANPTYSFDNKIIYAFDTGMVLNGMINLFKTTKSEKFLDAAIKIAEFLLTMQKSDGTFFSMHDANTGRSYNADDKWSATSGSYHAKISIGLLNVFEATNDNKFKSSAEKICKASIKSQKSDGRFASLNNTTHLHPHSYSIEGLTYAHNFFTHHKFINSAVAAIGWALSKQLSSGGLSTSFSGKIDTNERTDILAQVLRMATFMIRQDYLSDDYKENLLKLKNRLLQFQNNSEPHAGGFFYGYEAGTKINHINSWCSMFGLQALVFYDKYVKKEKIEIDLLV